MLEQRIIQQPEMKQAIETLKSEKNIGTVFEAVEHVASDAYFAEKNEDLQQKRTEIEAGLDQDILQSAVRLQDFSKLDANKPEYVKYLKAASLKEKIARELVKALIEGENSLELSETENVVLKGSLDLANAYDQFSFNWHQNVVASPFAQKLAAMGADDAKKYLQRKGALPATAPADTYYYMTFDEQKNGRVTSNPYAVSFKDSNAQILTTLDDMITKLGQVTTPDEENPKLYDYFIALRNAHGSTSPDIVEQDTLWKEVDFAWMKIKGRMQPLHMMESYDDTLGLRVEPEYGITFIDDRYKSVNDDAINTREHMLAYLQQTFGDKKVLAPLFPAMQTSEAKVYTMMAGGKRLSFRAAAQNLPNRVLVKELTGVKILQDMQTYQQRWDLQIPLLENLLGRAPVSQIFTPKQDLIELLAGAFVAGHEIGHNAFNVSTSRENIGEKNWKDIEENKSDMVSIAAVPTFLSYEKQDQLLKALFAFDARSISRVKEESGRPYLNSAVVIMNTFMESGILTQTDEMWNFTITLESAQNFFRGIEQALKNVVEVYNKQDKTLAEQYQQKYYAITPEINNLMLSLGVNQDDITALST